MKDTVTAQRYHDFCAGHRVVGHEGKCKGLHGHNYRVHFTCEASSLDSLGRVIDFSVIKVKLCEWLEEWWDHKMLLWKEDPMRFSLTSLANSGVVVVSFNPTAENMALHLLNVVGPRQLKGTGVELVEVRIEETRKCSATATKGAKT